jgi:hypothetical protein
MTALFSRQSEGLNLNRRLPHHCIPLFNLLQETEKHRLRIEPPIVAEAVLVQVGLEIALANGMIDAPQAVLEQAPKPFDSVRMNLADYVNLGRVIDSLVVIGTSRHVLNSMVGVQFVRKYRALGENVFTNHSEKRRAFHVIGNQGLDSAFPLDDPDHGSLNLVSCHRSASSALASSAHVGFVNLDALTSTAYRSAILFLHGATLFEHAPRGFVGDARLPLNLFSRDSAARLRHEIDRIEPSCEGCGRLVEDRPGSRMNMMAAMVARIRRATSYAMMLCHALAGVAKDAIRIEIVAKPFEAGRIIWKLRLESLQRVAFHCGLAIVVGHDFTYSQVKA